MQSLSRAEYNAVLRSDLSFFAQRCFAELNPQAAFAMNWHIEVIAARLTAVRDGKIRRLIINLPPRHLKSLMASIAFPAWCLGHDPSAQILLRQLRAGSRRQARPRLPQHYAETVVPADVHNPAGAAPPSRRGVSDHGPGIPAFHLQWRSTDR